MNSKPYDLFIIFSFLYNGKPTNVTFKNVFLPNIKKINKLIVISDKGIDKEYFEHKKIGKIKILQIRDMKFVSYFLSKVGLSNIIYYFKFKKSIIKEIESDKTKKNKIVLISIPPFWLVSYLKYFKNYKIWLDIRDPLYTNPFNNLLEKLILKSKEKLILKKVDIITSRSQSIMKYFSSKNKKCYFLPNYIRLKYFNFNNKKVILTKNKLTFAYFGSIYGPRFESLKKLVDVLNKSKLNFTIELYSNKNRLVKKILKKYPEKIILKPKITDEKEYFDELKKKDFLIILQNLNPPTNQIPIKLYDYLVSKRPIIYVGGEGELKETLKFFAPKNFIHIDKGTREISLKELKHLKIDNIHTYYQRLLKFNNESINTLKKVIKDIKIL